MSPSNGLQREHGTFASWLTGDFRETTIDPGILDPFVEYSGLSRARAKSFLEGGAFAPGLYAEDLGPTWGQFRDAFPLKIFIHQLVVWAVEADPSDPNRRTFAMAKILHELVHCGRAERNLDEDGDVGAMFEAEVFGAGTGNELVGEDYLPEEFIPAGIRALSSGVTTASGV